MCKFVTNVLNPRRNVIRSIRKCDSRVCPIKKKIYENRHRPRSHLQKLPSLYTLWDALNVHLLRRNRRHVL